MDVLNKLWNEKYSSEELMVRLKFIIGLCLTFTLMGIIFTILYSVIFVQQPLKAISPIDQKFFELIVPIATFLTGTLSGIMLAGNDKDAQKMALQAATRPTTVSPAPTTPSTPSTPSFGGGFSPSTPSTFSAPAAAAFTPQVVTGFGGKPAPAPAPQPEI